MKRKITRKKEVEVSRQENRKQKDMSRRNELVSIMRLMINTSLEKSLGEKEWTREILIERKNKTERSLNGRNGLLKNNFFKDSWGKGFRNKFIDPTIST